MPQKVLNQIKWLCKKIPKVEWSGILFYSIEGSIKDPENMVIILQEILPMQKGTATFTEYAFDERVVEFMMENEESENWKIGHIHSHNTMNVYFSGTDWSELEDNAPNHNFYVSLIVNNFMDFCAKTCFIAETEKSNFTARDENGHKYTYAEKEPVKEENLIVYDCEIESPVNKIEVTEEFDKKVEGIIKAAEKKTFTTYPHTRTLHTGYGRSQIYPVNPNSRVEKRKSPNSDAWGDFAFNSRMSDIEDAEEELKQDAIEEFTLLLLNTGNDTSEYTSIESLLEMYRTFGVTGKMLAKGVLDNYTVIYDNFFDKNTNKDDPEMFVEITEGVIDELKTELETTVILAYSNMIKPVVEALESMLDKFKKYEFSTIK